MPDGRVSPFDGLKDIKFVPFRRIIIDGNDEDRKGIEPAGVRYWDVRCSTTIIHAKEIKSAEFNIAFGHSELVVPPGVSAGDCSSTEACPSQTFVFFPFLPVLKNPFFNSHPPSLLR
jgi:hypothetical protein